MQTIRLIITTLILSVSSLTVGNAALADNHTGKAAYRDHGRHHHVPRYASPPRAYGHNHYQYKHHGIHKKHGHYRHFGKVYDWRRDPHRFNNRHSDYSGYRVRQGSHEHRAGRDDYRQRQDQERRGSDHSRRTHTAYARSDRH